MEPCLYRLINGFTSTSIRERSRPALLNWRLPFGPGGDNVVFKTLFKIATEDRRYMIKYRGGRW